MEGNHDCVASEKIHTPRQKLLSPIPPFSPLWKFPLMILDVNLYLSLFKFFEKYGNVTWNYSPTSPQYPPSVGERKVDVVER